jgi:hypothetical protein
LVGFGFESAGEGGYCVSGRQDALERNSQDLWIGVLRDLLITC